MAHQSLQRAEADRGSLVESSRMPDPSESVSSDLPTEVSRAHGLAKEDSALDEEATDGGSTAQLEGATDSLAGSSRRAEFGERVSRRLLSERWFFRPQDSLVALQKWEGTVLGVHEDGIVARLVDLDGESSDLEAEIPLQELSQGDKQLVTAGAVFYWTIGYLDTAGGQRRRESVIRFRALPGWRAPDLQKAERQAEETREKLAWK